MAIMLDFECSVCGNIFEEIVYNSEVEKTKCPNCSNTADRIFPQKSPNFKLVYNQQKDMVDWDGNTTRYYDEYKKMKAEGKNPRIPKLDGE